MLWQMVGLTLRDPASAARALMALQVPRAALRVGLLLVSVLNTAMFVLANWLVPPQPGQPVLFDIPAPIYLLLVICGLVMMIHAVFWTGRILGGTGSLVDVMVLILWLQALRVAVQVIILALIFIAPLLSAVVVFATGLLGIFIMLHFVNQAHRLNSLWRSAGVLVASLLAIVVGLSVLLSLLGGPIVGASYV